MSHRHEDVSVPRGALLGIALLIAISLSAVVAVKLIGGHEAAKPVGGEVINSRDLRFVDLGGGRVAIYAWPDGRLVDTLDAGTDNFIRGVIRGLARERRGIGAGDREPFRISLFENGRLTLEDRATGRVLVLEAFGATNARAFGRLLETRSANLQTG